MVRIDRPFELVRSGDEWVVQARVRGGLVLSLPLLNRGTAFSLEEREALGLTGLLPSAVSTMEAQLRRVYGQYQRQPDDLAKRCSMTRCTWETGTPGSGARPTTS